MWIPTCSIAIPSNRRVEDIPSSLDVALVGADTTSHYVCYGKKGRRAFVMARWRDMENPNLHRLRNRMPWHRLVLVLAAALIWIPTRALAAAVALTQDDFTLTVYAQEGSSWRTLNSNTLSVFFNPHECSCPDTLAVAVQLTSSGQTNLGSSTVTANFLLGDNCSTSAASCVSLGQVSFSASQTADSPKFNSNLVFQTVDSTATVDCGNLTAGSTTIWALLTEDGAALSFSLSVALPVIATTVAAPTAVTALGSNEGMLVSWTPPEDKSQVAGYQVLCLPVPAKASTAGYETTCWPYAASTGDTAMSPADTTELCSADVAAGETSVRISGLANGTPYTVAVIAIDYTGGISALSPLAVATPQPTDGFYETYKKEGGSASGCSLSPSPRPGCMDLPWIAFVAALIVVSDRCLRRKRRRKTTSITHAMVFLLVFCTSARAQIPTSRSSDDWTSESAEPRIGLPPDWGGEIGLSLYRPDVDSEFGNGIHPYADTFSSSRHLMPEAEVDRYFRYGFGTWGLGLRVGYYKVTAASFYADDGVTRSGDETALHLYPFALSLLYRANGLAGLRRVPLIPYLKLGLDGVAWTATNTGGSASHAGFTPGWHAAAGMVFGLNLLGAGPIKPDSLADPCALFFEWDYSAINGLGLGKKLHVGDNTWFAGLMFDL